MDPHVTHLLKSGKVEFHLERKSTFLTNAVPSQKYNCMPLSTLVQDFEDKYYVV